jgi:hypothetical protein
MPYDVQPMLDEEYGSTDNRMTLSPTTYDWVGEMESGKEYTVSCKVRVQTPGRMAVVAAVKPPEMEAAEGEPGTESPDVEGDHDLSGTPGGREGEAPQMVTGNPAVDSLMAKRSRNAM